MRPLEYPKASSVKPLLQRMAEEKRFQMERGSIGGSYFMVQLPDGSWEKRMKMPINVDPGVHSSFNLDQLVPGGKKVDSLLFHRILFLILFVLYITCRLHKHINKLFLIIINDN